LIRAVFDVHAPFRVAQVPIPPTLLTRVFRPEERPRVKEALPATDGRAIWLPAQMPNEDQSSGLRTYRCMALLQAIRAKRGSANHLHDAVRDHIEDSYLLLEAHAAHLALSRLLPGMKQDLDDLRSRALASRPSMESFPAERRRFEHAVREVMGGESTPFELPIASSSPAESLELARRLTVLLNRGAGHEHRKIKASLFKDIWTGELKQPSDVHASELSGSESDRAAQTARPKSSHLPRRPEVREAQDDEDDAKAGAWMIQTAQPQERAEDPWGMQRPADRDEGSADEYADALSELSQARLVRTPGQAKEILLADDPPEARAKRSGERAQDQGARFSYPEWDWRTQTYREPGAIVHVLPPQLGPIAWVAETLRTHQSMCNVIRRRFEMLRGARERQRRQLEGEEIDLEAYVDARADLIARRPMPQNLYRSVRPSRRDLAVTLLVDISGSTDAWIATHRRVVDVEREALLLVCIALEGLREPYSVLAFSGEGPSRVTVRDVKTFNEAYGTEVGQRIAALEPELYTRAGAAIRHASSLLMKQTAKHRLLLLLSDGKPNDLDEYDGRYGAEDMRQAVIEARLQGIFPFCLTIDRQAASYLPQVFGANHYALLPKPELLPSVLLEWIRRLLAD
jgi:nitric oxide reductase NorD protein